MALVFSKTDGQGLFRALRHPNYRRFYLGQGISLIGSWMQRVAMTWLVYRLTQDAFYLGLIAFCSQAPNFFLAPFAGVLADRFSKKKLLIAMHVVEMVQAILLAWLTLTGQVTVNHIILLSLLFGVATSFETPIRQAFVVDMLEDRTDLPNAIALNSTLFNLARLVGPAVAGILIDQVGEGVCFLVNAISYIAVVWAIFTLKVPERTPSNKALGFASRMLEGFSYTWNHYGIRMILILLIIASLTAMPYITLLPIFAAEVLSGTSRTFGFLTGAIGIGALTGALFLGTRAKNSNLSKVIVTNLFLFSGSLILFSLSRHFVLSFALLTVVGFAMMTMVASCNTMIQNLVDDRMRGRVMSHYVMAFIGLGPFGSLLAGVLASSIGAWETVLIGAAILLVAGFISMQGILNIKIRQSSP